MLMQGLTFDELPIDSCNSEDLDFRVASELFDGISKISLKDFENLKCLKVGS